MNKPLPGCGRGCLEVASQISLETVGDVITAMNDQRSSPMVNALKGLTAEGRHRDPRENGGRQSSANIYAQRASNYLF